MAIAFGAAATQQVTNSATDTAVLPSGYSAGSILLCHLETKAKNNTDHDVSGWARLGNVTYVETGPVAIVQSVWYKIAASASETAPTVSCTSPNVMLSTCSYFDADAGFAAPVTLADGNAGQQSTYAGGNETTTPGAMGLMFVSSGDTNNLGLDSGNEQGFSLGYGGSSYDTTSGTDGAQAMAYKAGLGTSQQFPTWRQNSTANDGWGWHELELTEAATSDPYAAEIYNGAAWVAATVEIYDGAAWQPATPELLT